MRVLPALALVALVAGCTAQSPTPGGGPPRSAAPEGSASLPLDGPTLEDAARWQYREVSEADLDSDGKTERVVLAADAEIDDRGRVAWDHGHRWVAYVEEPDGTQTALFARFVPNGNVELELRGSDGARRVGIHERGPFRDESFEIEYRGPGRARVVARSGGATTRP